MNNFMSRTFRFFKKAAATLLLLFGIPLSGVAIAEMASSNATVEEKEEALAILLMLTLPSTVLGSWLVWGLHKDYQWKLENRAQIEDDRLRSIFFRILEENRGQTTTLRLAKEANLSGEEARSYLERKAKEFEATINVGEQGEITYQFYL